MRVAQTNMHCFSTPARRVRTCFFVSLICAAWNLFGDVCFIDFYLAHMTFEGFGTIDHAVTISRTGNIFDFNKAWPVKLAQASGWMYPIWALTTSYAFDCSIIVFNFTFDFIIFSIVRFTIYY